MKRWYVLLLAMTLMLGPASAGAIGQPRSDASRDFDYQFGVWRVHVARLLDPASASPHWTHYDGTHAVTRLLEGHANVGVLEVNGPSGRLEGLQLRLYDPANGQWRLSFASGSDGIVQPPSSGRFEDGRATFFSNQLIGGFDARVRSTTTRFSATAYRDVIAYSTSRGGDVWHAIWIADYTKIGSAAQESLDETAANQDSTTAFDFQVGRWCAHLERLTTRLRGARAWRNYDGTLVVHRLWSGRANVGVLDVRDGTTRFQSILLRTYDPHTARWSDYAGNVSDGSVALPPVTGRFSNGRGELYDRETFEGRPILVRYVFDEITARSSRFVQSFSADEGKTWEPNAIARFTRAG
ncbi:MAG: hypothetical protein WBE59_01050 [Candidatus Cybelea sp.]